MGSDFSTPLEPHKDSRFRVFPVQLASSREHPRGIPLVVQHFADKYARRMKKQIKSIPPETMKALERWYRPENIREIESLIETSVILSP